MEKLYKYLAPDLLTKVFRPKAAACLKASYPEDFNDPYELFLTLKTKGVDAEVLAFYQETVGELPQWPTLCFSKRPDVVPMWAHYARECTGFVVEIDEAVLRSSYQEASAKDITYGSEPASIDTGMVAHALATSKPRHTYFLQQAAIAAAYFSKSSVWSYELERRFVVGDSEITKAGGHMLLPLPDGCVTAIIAGARSDPSIDRAIKRRCDKIGCSFFKMHLARNAMRPFFTDRSKDSFLFEEGSIRGAASSCSKCREPIEPDMEDLCHWCSITDAHRMTAARYNPMRRLAHVGLLEQYYADVGKIGASGRSRKA